MNDNINIPIYALASVSWLLEGPIYIYRTKRDIHACFVFCNSGVLNCDPAHTLPEIYIAMETQ